MKTILLITSITLLVSYAKAQYGDDRNSLTLSGHAISNVMPDTYSLTFGLEEYFEDDERGTRKLISLDDILEQLKENLVRFGLPAMKLNLLNVTSTGQHYGQNSQDYLRKSYGLIGVTDDYALLLRIVENMRFKGLSGINVRGEFTDPKGLGTSVCHDAMEDAEKQADLAFDKLGLKKGKILVVNIHNNSHNMGLDNYTHYQHQNVYGQYSFSMAPAKMHCSVGMRFEIEAK